MKKSPDKNGQSEKSKKPDNIEKDETFLIEVYNMSVKKQNGYIEFIHTSEAMDEIELQTGLLFEQTAVREHFRQPEQVQVEVQKKSKEIEYGD